MLSKDSKVPICNDQCHLLDFKMFSKDSKFPICNDQPHFLDFKNVIQRFKDFNLKWSASFPLLSSILPKIKTLHNQWQVIKTQLYFNDKCQGFNLYKNLDSIWILPSSQTTFVLVLKLSEWYPRRRPTPYPWGWGRTWSKIRSKWLGHHAK